MSKDTFKCYALPPIPKYVGSFNEFEYSVEPFEDAEQTHRAAKARTGD